MKLPFACVKIAAFNGGDRSTAPHLKGDASLPEIADGLAPKEKISI